MTKPSVPSKSVPKNDSKPRHLGAFNTQEEAAYAYRQINLRKLISLYRKQQLSKGSKAGPIEPTGIVKIEVW